MTLAPIEAGTGETVKQGSIGEADESGISSETKAITPMTPTPDYAKGLGKAVIITLVSIGTIATLLWIEFKELVK